MPDYTKPTAQSSRRLSLSSNTGSVTSEAPPRHNGYRVPSNGAMSNRPGTSQSVRPESSMSVRGQSVPPITVKKTRAPAQPRGEAPKPSRVRRKSPLNDGGAAPIGTDVAILPPSRSSSVVLPTTEISTSQTSDIDSLTSGMKKVKISLTTKAQREAKQGAKSAAAKPAATKSSRPQPARKESAILPPPRRPTPASSTNGTAAPPQPESKQKTIPPMSSTPQPSLPSHLQMDLHQPSEVPLPASSPPPPILHPTQPNVSTPQSTPPQITQPPQLIKSASASTQSSSSTPDIFVPYQPEGPPPPAITQQEPLRWLEPNTGTPGPSPMKSPMRKEDLPVWTSTSAIPFAVGIGNGGKMEGGQAADSGKKEVDIWEVPETPGRA